MGISLNNFFGLKLPSQVADLDFLLDLLGLKQQIEDSETVKKLIDRNGYDHPIVCVGKRQQVLKILKPIINKRMLPYDPRFYIKKVNTATVEDRLYGCEEKLLQYSLVIATTKPLKLLIKENGQHQLRELRGNNSKDRFEHYWKVLGKYTGDKVRRYKQQMAFSEQGYQDEKPGFMKNILSSFKFSDR